MKSAAMSAGPSTIKKTEWPVIALWVSLALTFVGFFVVMPRFGATGLETACAWLFSTWTKENNYEHGPLVVGVAAWLVWRALPAFRAAKFRKNSVLGLSILGFGVLMFLAGCRTIQPRVVVASAPVLILGGLIFVQGWERAKHMIFPLSMFAFVIPMPGFQQATTGLQLIATKMAHHASGVFGITTVLAGNKVYDPNGNWGSWEIDEGCSGIRSLVALMLVTYVYGMIVHKKWSERLPIFAACIPVAIVANAVRVTSILVMARYGNLEFAKSTWHDYSGFLSFGTALAMLMLLSAVMRQGLRVLKPKVKVTKISHSSGPPGPGGALPKPQDTKPPKPKSTDTDANASGSPPPASFPVADPY